jgi:hypothetical protein
MITATRGDGAAPDGAEGGGEGSVSKAGGSYLAASDSGRIGQSFRVEDRSTVSGTGLGLEAPSIRGLSRKEVCLEKRSVSKKTVSKAAVSRTTPIQLPLLRYGAVT